VAPEDVLGIRQQYPDIRSRRAAKTMIKMCRRTLLRLLCGAAGATVAACSRTTPVAEENPVPKAITDYARDGDTASVRRLIDEGASVDARDDEGMTPLLYAAREGHMQVAALLIAEGADLTATEPRDDRTPLHLSAYLGSRGVVKELVASGAEVDAVDRIGLTPLYLAVHSGHRDIAEMLLDSGADVQGAGKTEDGPIDTPLHAAAGTGHVDVAELLISRGADVNARSHSPGDDRTPLHYTAYSGHLGIAELLILRGADINAEAQLHRWRGTPLDMAIERGNDNVADLLSLHGGRRRGNG
jgi:ankyrin repeat protein